MNGGAGAGGSRVKEEKIGSEERNITRDLHAI